MLSVANKPLMLNVVAPTLTGVSLDRTRKYKTRAERITRVFWLVVSDKEKKSFITLAIGQRTQVLLPRQGLLHLRPACRQHVRQRHQSLRLSPGF